MLSIAFSKLSTKQLDFLGEQTISLSEKNANKEVISNLLFHQLKSKHAEYRGVVIRQTYSGLGEALKNDDIIRGKSHSGIVNIVNGFAAFSDTAKQAPALLLQKIITETGFISRLNYAEESVVLNKLIERFSDPAAVEAIAIIGIDEEVEKLTNIQKRFDAMYTEQLDINSDLRQQPTASSMRRELEDILRSYYSLVSAFKNVVPWKDIYSDLNELLKKF